MRKVAKHNPQAEHVIEQPQDPREWHPKGKECPTFLNWTETRETAKVLGLQEVRVCQGGLGHQTKKPTTLLCTSPELMELEGVGNENKARDWPEDLADRMRMSKELAEWAPGLVEVLKMVVRRKAGEGPRVKVLTTKEKEAMRSWQAHVDMNHLPYRRDCGVCVESMGKDRPRRRIKAPEPFTLSLDVGGPFVKGQDQVQYHDPRYFMVAVVTIPMAGNRPMVEGLRKLAGDEEPMQEIPQPPDEAIEELLREPEGQPDEKQDEAQEDPFKEEEGETGHEVIDDARLKQLDESNQRWRQFMADAEHQPVKSLTMALPIKSRKASEVIKATARVVARLRSLNIPIVRVHTDRAQEFCGRDFQAWLRARDLWHTTTAGDEPSTNARAENELKIIKGRARTLMKSARCEVTQWPLAIRYASEERFRRQLRECGVPTPAILPFGVRAYAKQKAWQNKHAMWRSPMTPVRVWGPACDMSMTSRGYFVEIGNTGKYMRSTIVVVPTQAPCIADSQQAPAEEPLQPQEAEDMYEYSPSFLDEAEAEAYAEESAGMLAPGGELEVELQAPEHGALDRELPPHDPPPRRLNGKQAAPIGSSRPHEPTLRTLQVGGEWVEDENCKERWQGEDEDTEEELMIAEHDGLLRWAREERHVAKDASTMRVMLEAEVVAQELEQQLEDKFNKRRSIRKAWVQEKDEEEVLQTRVVSAE